MRASQGAVVVGEAEPLLAPLTGDDDLGNPGAGPAGRFPIAEARAAGLHSRPASMGSFGAPAVPLGHRVDFAWLLSSHRSSHTDIHTAGDDGNSTSCRINALQSSWTSERPQCTALRRQRSNARIVPGAPLTQDLGRSVPSDVDATTKSSLEILEQPARSMSPPTQGDTDPPDPPNLPKHFAAAREAGARIGAISQLSWSHAGRSTGDEMRSALLFFDHRLDRAERNLTSAILRSMLSDGMVPDSAATLMSSRWADKSRSRSALSFVIIRVHSVLLNTITGQYKADCGRSSDATA